MDAKSKQEFLELYKDAHAPLSRFCMAKSYGVMDPADLVSETVLAALEGFDKLKNKKAFLAYLFTIANNKVNGALRRKKFSGSYHEQQANSQVDTTINSDARFDIGILYDALNELPDKQKEALILFEISGFSIKEIMEIQESGESAVKQRLKRGREKLAALFQADKRKAIAGIALLWMSQNANSAPTIDSFFEIAKGMEIPISQEQIVSIINSYQGAAGVFATVSAKVAGIGLSGATALAVLTVVSFGGEEPSIDSKESSPTLTTGVVEVVSTPTLEAPESRPENASYVEQVETSETPEELEVQPATTASFLSAPTMAALPTMIPLVSLNRNVQGMPWPETLPLDTTKKVTSQKAQLEPGATVQIEVYDSDLRIEVWDNDYAEVKTSISFDAKDDESAEIADRNLKAEVEQVGNKLIIKGPSYCHIFNQFHMKYGKCTFENGEKAFVKNIKIDYTVYVPKDAPLDLDVAYGKLVVPATSNDLKIKLNEGDLYAGNVAGSLELELHYSDATIGTFKTGELDLYESDLTFKTADKIKLKSGFSNLTGEKVNTLNIDGNEGRIKIDEIATLDGDMSYMRGSFKTLKSVDLKAYECILEAQSADVLKVKSGYSSFVIDVVGELELTESREDDFEIKHLKLVSGESQYSGFEIDQLDESAKLKTYECSVVIEQVSQRFKSLDFDGQYTRYILHFERQSTYELVVNGHYTSLSYPEDDSEVTKWVDKDDMVELNCTVNKSGDDRSLVKFNCYEGFIDLAN